MSPVIVNIRKKNLIASGYTDLANWLEDSNHIYIGRNCPFVKGTNNSKWLNPYTVKKYGRDECLKLYEKHVRSNLWDDLNELDSMVLGCWCKLSLPCHGKILVRLFHEKLI